jgi:hypothetical protein
MAEKDGIFDPNEIDYSGVQSPSTTQVEDWEPPPHVFYGKRLPNGKSEKEPVYVYKEYPRMLYGRIEGRVRARVVNSDDEKKKLLDAGFGLSPADFGIETLPGPDEQLARNIANEVLTPEIETETVEIIKRKRGRPAKGK